MVRWIRVCALLLCLMMALLPTAALAAVAVPMVDDIVDDNVTAEQPIVDPNAAAAAFNESAYQQTDSGITPATMTAGADPNAGAADEQTETAPAPTTSSDPNFDAPTFSDINPADAPVAVTVTNPDGTMSTVAAPKMASDITKNSKFKLSEGKASVLTDNKSTTTWSNTKAGKMRITLPANDTAGGLFIEWGKKPSVYSIKEYDSGNNELAAHDESTYPGYSFVIPLNPETKRLEFAFKKKVTISTIRIFSAGDLPDGIQNWQPPLEKADLMVISAHQDDEFLYFGGTIPYYNSVEGKAVQVVYMANCGRARYGEALTGLWAVGMRNYPDFVGLQDKKSTSLKQAKTIWKENTVIKQIVIRIRKYKPDVIVTHDLKGEYGHGAHMLTAEATQKAIEMAADPTKYPDSANTYGVWQVSKLYLHLLSDQQIKMDWTVAAPELGGQTPAEMAKLGYAAHKSQHKSFTYEDGGKYDNSLFGLSFSNVGEDVEKNDFFEHIGAAESTIAPEEEIDETEAEGEYFPEGEEGESDWPEGVEGEDGDDVEVPETETEVTPPVEEATPVNRTGLLVTLLATPAAVGASAYGLATARKSMKKRRREARKQSKSEAV